MESGRGGDDQGWWMVVEIIWANKASAGCQWRSGRHAVRLIVHIIVLKGRRCLELVGLGLRMMMLPRVLKLEAGWSGDSGARCLGIRKRLTPSNLDTLIAGYIVTGCWGCSQVDQFGFWTVSIAVLTPEGTPRAVEWPCLGSSSRDSFA